VGTQKQWQKFGVRATLVGGWAMEPARERWRAAPNRAANLAALMAPASEKNRKRVQEPFFVGSCSRRKGGNDDGANLDDQKGLW